LLYGKLRPYLNKVWLASFDGVCSTDILVFRKNSFLNNEYLAAFMLNQDFVEYTRQRMSGVQHPRINYTTLSQYILPIPPNAEQVVIAEKIQKTFSITENSEETMLQETKQAEILRQSILKVAFEGRLVPQNSNDESAEELLERIKAERFSNKESKLELPCYVK
jgi:type I restriction enzyme S subunit